MIASTAETHPKPFVVSQGRKQPSGTLARRVEAALDADFFNGSMPA